MGVEPRKTPSTTQDAGRDVVIVSEPLLSAFDAEAFATAGAFRSFEGARLVAESVVDVPAGVSVVLIVRREGSSAVGSAVTLVEEFAAESVIACDRHTMIKIASVKVKAPPPSTNHVRVVYFFSNR
jgi:hypothetical protein